VLVGRLIIMVFKPQ